MLFGIVTTVSIVVVVLLISRKKQAKPANGSAGVGELTEAAKRKIRTLPATEQAKLLSELRLEIERHFAHTYSEAAAKGIEARVANELALFRTASFALTGREIPLPEHERDLQMETVPFNKLPPEQSKAAFQEYIISKLFSEKADYVVLYDALREFSEDVFRRSETEADPDVFIYNMIFRETRDWQRYIAADISSRFAAPRS